MKEETYKKAGALKKEIEELRDIISGLRFQRRRTDRSLDPDRCPWWKLRALNLKRDPKKGEEAHIIIFDNTHPRGTEIKVDEEFLEMLTNYFENKKKEKEKEFEALS